MNSVNFITCHDGFTLNDLIIVPITTSTTRPTEKTVRDGADQNFSWNAVVRRTVNHPGSGGMRQRQIRNFLAILLLSRGRAHAAGRR